MRHKLLFLLCLLVFIPNLHAEENDDIPDNCVNRYGEYYRQQIFPRYEPQNRRLVLIDWNTGADHLVLASDVPDTLISAWSVDCRYLAVATGDNQSRATHVYDTITGAYIGEVPDARGASHLVTWGPGGYLVVETRNGGILWNVPANIQYQYDTGFNTTSYRNFNQLRWDTEQNILIANLAVGGRIVIDLATGNLTTVESTVPGEIIAGGERFSCGARYNDQDVSFARRVSRLQLGYAPSGGIIYLGRYRSGAPDEILETLMADVDIINIASLGWSASCKYIAGAVLVQGGRYDDDITPIYETWVWEYATKRLVGVFEDARIIPHPISWDTAEKHLLVQTRLGAYLWNLETNDRVLVTDHVEYICGYSYSCYRTRPQSFYSTYWDAGRQQLLAVPVDQSNTIVAYDANTGEEVERFNILPEPAEYPVRFITSDDSRLILSTYRETAYLINRENGQQTTFQLPNSSLSRSVISTDNRYIVTYQYNNAIYIWDINNLSQPIYIHDIPRPVNVGDIYFTNGTTLVFPNYSFTARLNVETGEWTGLPPAIANSELQTPINFTPVEGTSGKGESQSGYASAQSWDCPIQPYYNGITREFFLNNFETGERRLIAENLNTVVSMEISPDCQTVFTRIQELNEDLPYDETPADTTRPAYRREVALVLWDMVTGQPFITIEQTQTTRRRTHLYWSPNSDRLLLRHDSNTTLINTREQQAIPLAGDFAIYPNVYWDYERGLLFVSNLSTIRALDLRDGSEQLHFTVEADGQGTCTRSRYAGCGMSFSEDRNWLFIYGGSEFAVWNINTLDHAYIPLLSASRRGALISPDGRYLVISRGSVRVWDLWSLPENYEDRLPIALYNVGEVGVVQSVEFVDNTTLEVVTWLEGEDSETTRYEVTTGTPLD